MNIYLKIKEIALLRKCLNKQIYYNPRVMINGVLKYK